MKKIKKIMSVVLIMAAVVVCCTACGLDMSKVKGDWTLDTMGGKTMKQLGEEADCDPWLYFLNATVTDDSFTVTSTNGTQTFKIQVKDNGFECLDDSGNIYMSVKYDSDKNTLTYQAAGADGNPVDIVLKKGTYTAPTEADNENNDESLSEEDNNNDEAE